MSNTQRNSNLRTRAESVPSLPQPNSAEDEPPEGTIFEELVTQYEKLVGRAEDMIVHTICNEVDPIKPKGIGYGVGLGFALFVMQGLSRFPP